MKLVPENLQQKAILKDGFDEITNTYWQGMCLPDSDIANGFMREYRIDTGDLVEFICVDGRYYGELRKIHKNGTASVK